MQDQQSQKPDFPPQPFIQKLLDKNMIRFFSNEHVDDEQDIFILVNYFPEDQFVILHGGYHVFSIQEYYVDDKFENYIVNYTDEVLDPEELENVNDIMIYKQVEL